MNSAIAQLSKKKMKIQETCERMTLLSEMKSVMIEKCNLAKQIIGKKQVPATINIFCQ